MAAPIAALVAEAKTAGVQIGHDVNGTLTLRATKSAAPLARELRARETEVIAYLRWGATFDPYAWQHAKVADPAPCVLCGQPAILRHPDTGLPCHKVCDDASHGPTTSRGV